MSYISFEMTKLCYEEAKRIYPKKDSIKTTAENIYKKTNMNLGSVKAYIKAFFQMRNGEKLSWDLSELGLKFYFEHLYKDFGKDGLQNALVAVKEYLKFDPQNHPGMETIVNDVENKYLGENK